jgi:hypothetical protein
VIEIVAATPIGKALDDLVLIIEGLGNDALADRVLYVPL